jgi:hypothetical protein
LTFLIFVNQFEYERVAVAVVAAAAVVVVAAAEVYQN